MSNKTRLYVFVVALAAFSLVAGAAFAQTTPYDAVNTGIAGLVTDLKAMINANIPVLFGLLALTIGVPFAVRFARRLVK